MATRTSRQSRLIGALLVVIVTGAESSGVYAATPNWLGRALTLRFGEKGTASARPERYQIDTGGGFILDRTQHGALLKFDDSPEIWALSAARGPRGDMIFSNDLGQTLVRTTRLGGVTVFTPRFPQGSAAAPEGASGPIRVNRVEPAQLFQRLLADSVRASHAAGQPISFQALDADPASSGVIADAGLLASLAIMQLSMASGGRPIVAHLKDVDIVQGRKVGVALTGSTLRISVVPREGVAGRPSTASILRALGAEAPTRTMIGVSRH